MKIFYGSTFINKEALKEAEIDYQIKLEYYKIINEDDLKNLEKMKYGIDVVKTEYITNTTKIEEKEIKNFSNDENLVDRILEIFKNNEVTPISVHDVLSDLFQQLLYI